ncbi:MAG: hypothetical protein AAGJ81_00395 [Verrucomicrobiota bacterium]
MKRITVSATSVFLAFSLSAQISVDNSQFFTDFDNTFSTPQFTWTFSGFDASGSDKLVIGTGAEGDNEDGVVVVDSITYNGQSLTSAVQQNNGQQNASIFYLDNPGAAGDIVVTFSGNTFGTNGVGVGVLALSGTADGVGATGSDPSRSASFNTNFDNSLVFASFVANSDSGGPPTADSPLDVAIGSYANTGSASGIVAYDADAGAAGPYTAAFTSVGNPLRPVTVAAEFYAIPEPNVAALVAGMLAFSAIAVRRRRF